MITFKSAAVVASAISLFANTPTTEPQQIQNITNATNVIIQNEKMDTSSEGKNETSKVALTLSPGIHKIKENLHHGESRKIKINVTNKSTSSQLIKIIPSELISVDNTQIWINENETKEIELEINVPFGESLGSKQEYVYIQTITPLEVNRIILKNNIYFNVTEE